MHIAGNYELVCLQRGSGAFHLHTALVSSWIKPAFQVGEAYITVEVVN